jgi:hypothetical protein
MSPRPPLPPSTEDAARQEVQAAEDAWNTRDPERVAGAYSEDWVWRNRHEFVTGRAEIVSTTNETKCRPAESLITVTLDGADGSGRDHRTGTSPIFGSRSFPLGSTLKRALAVNLMACRVSLRDRNRGSLTFGPFRSPLREAK